MASSNVCGLSSPLEIKATQAKIFQAIKTANKENALNEKRLSFSKSLREIGRQFKKEDLNELINIVNNYLIKSGDIAYRKIGGNWSQEDIESSIKGLSNTTLEVEESASKTDSLDQDSLQNISSSSFLDSVYGTSTAKDKLLNSVRREFKGLFFISNGYEISSLKTVNRNIRNYQEQLFDIVKRYYKKIVNDPDFDNLEFSKEGLRKLNEYLKIYNYEYTIGNLQALSSSRKYSDKSLALNSLFILNHFDQLLQLLLKKSLNIKEGTYGVFSPELNDKYSVSLRNNNITTNWRDDDKDVDAIAEANALIKLLIESIPEYTDNGVELSTTLSYKSVSSTNAAVRQLMNHKSALQPLRDIVKVRDDDNPDGLNPEYANLNMRDLVSDFFEDQIEGPRKLYTVLASNSKLCRMFGLNKQQIATIKSLYHGIFDPNNINSFYRVYLNTLDQPDSAFNPRTGYYMYLTQNLGTQESIDAQQYSRQDGKMSNVTLKDSGDTAKTYALDQRLGGILNVELTPNFKHFELDYSELSSETPYIDIKVGDLTIRKYAKIVNPEILDSSGKVIEDISTVMDRFYPFIKELTGFNVTNGDFIVELNNREGNYQNGLLKLTSNILYNYSVSKYLRDSKNLNGVFTDNLNHTLEETWKKKLGQFYKEDSIPKINKNIKGGQLSYTNNSDTPIKIALVKTENAINGVIDDSIVKDASGSAIASVGLDQLATKYISQVRRVGKTNHAVRRFIVNRLYRGQEFARDFKSSNGTVKKATAMSESEHFIANFIYDYMNQMYDETGELTGAKTIKVMPTVISDKSRIMKTLFDLSEYAYNYRDAEGKPIPYYKLTTEQWQEIARRQLGDYYEATYDQAKTTFQEYYNNHLTALIGGTLEKITPLTEPLTIFKNYVLDKKISFYGLNIDTNFREFNEIINNIANDESFAGNYHKNPSDLIKDLIHDITVIMQKRNVPVELNSIIDYTVGKNEKVKRTVKNEANEDVVIETIESGIIGNDLLMDQLYRWGKIKDNSPIMKAYGLEDAYKNGQGYGRADNFFSKKKYQYVTDLLKDNCEIRTQDSLFNEFKDGAFKKLTKDGWVRGENVVFAQIKYNIYEFGKTEPTERTLNITDKDSIRNSYIYKEIFKNRFYDNYESVRDYIDIESPKFDLEKFIEAIHIYNSQSSFYKELGSIRTGIKEKLKEELGEEFAKANLTGFDAKVFQSMLTGETPIFESTDETLDQDKKSKLEAAVNKILKDYDFSKNKYDQHRSLTSKLDKPTFIMNPHLEKYQAIDFILSQEYVLSSVGTHINHPYKPKPGKTLIEKESEVWGQQVKRNVSMTASKHKFVTTSLDGIRGKIRAAVIEDDKDVVFAITGKHDSVKPFDGATFCSGITNYLENNSLGGDHAGVDKKQFIHDYNEKTGTGVIVKTAGFAVTNERIRNSEFMIRLNKKMMNIPHKDLSGNDIYVDITKDYIDYIGRDLVSCYGDIVYEKKGVIYRVVGIKAQNVTDEQGNQKVLTIVKRQVLTKDGWGQYDGKNDLQLDIRTNYDIWNDVFGGEYSIKFDGNIADAKLDTPYDYTEASWVQMTYAANHVGTKKDGITPTTNEHVDQVLKRSIIDYVITEGAIKQGAANINSKKAYFDENYELSTMEINMHDAGIQLDAEHHADESVLSLMTQVLNALNARGYSYQSAEDVYNALHDLAMEALQGFDWSDVEIQNAETPEMQKFLAGVIVQAVKTVSSTDGNLITALSNEIMKQYEQGGEVSYDLIRENMPMSNSGTFGKMVSQLASLLTKKCIRIKFPGSMDVLVPSNKIYKLYDGHLLSHYKGDLSRVPQYANKFIKATDVILGRTYKIYNPQTGLQIDVNGFQTNQDILIDDPRDYWKLKQMQESNPNIMIQENLRAGRDLASYNVRITTKDGIYNIWDLDSVKDCYDISSKLEKYRKILKNDPTKKEQVFVELSNITVPSLSIDQDLFVPSNVSAIIDEMDKQTIRNLQQILDSLSENTIVSIDGEPKAILSKEVQPYELIMTKIYETTFGLKSGDDVAAISKNKAFFLKRALDKWESNVDRDLWDVELKTVNGKHVYLIDSSTSISKKGLTKVPIAIRQDADGVHRIDPRTNEVLQHLSSETDEIWVDANGNEVIVTDNLNFFVDKTQFLNITISPRLCPPDNKQDQPSAEDEITKLGLSLANVLNKLNLCEKHSVEHLLEWVGFENIVQSVGNFEQLWNNIYDAQNTIKAGYDKIIHAKDELDTFIKAAEKSGDYSFINNSTGSKVLDRIIESSKEIHTSFIKSLNVLAARIPAQSHQSFMAMKVVGFENSGKNSAYVSRMQIWMQGSDYKYCYVAIFQNLSSLT